MPRPVLAEIAIDVRGRGAGREDVTPVRGNCDHVADSSARAVRVM
ncbi:MAG: hypothetical protein ABSB01_14820 [Streptosporangiaceae bacterium]|jgi:hypothetical protein